MMRAVSSRPDPADLARMRRLRWTSFALVCAAYVLSFFHRIAPNPMAGELRAAFGLSAAASGNKRNLFHAASPPASGPSPSAAPARSPAPSRGGPWSAWASRSPSCRS